nr:IS30 family transposase [Novosphingobium sp. Chol11]
MRSARGRRKSRIAAASGTGEGDLLIFRREYGKTNLTSLVERCSRFTFLTRNLSRHSAGVMAGIDRHLRDMPPPLRRSITFDRGTEFAAFATLRNRLGITSYFCLPSAPWQKGGVELQRADTALPTLRHRPGTALRQGNPGRCRSPQQHTSQMPGLSHPA